jgi:Ala-tRNA(Pro) deacylase
MAIALTLQQYLTQHGIEYDLLPHTPTQSSTRTAETSHVSGDRLAKAVLLREGTGYLLAVLPASRHIRLDALAERLNHEVELATEEEIEAVFDDCVRGALPPVGAAYGVDVIVDDSIADQPIIYFEGGDHATLVHMTGDQFARVNPGTLQGQFSRL